MSIVTKTGDSGTTALMYGHRVPKSHPRIAAVGAVDELNAALGMARATATDAFVSENILAIQKNLVTLMGELGILPEDLPRYINDGFPLVTPEMTERSEKLVAEIEAQNVSFRGWATPGATGNAAALDVARTICRRAERDVCELNEAGQLTNPQIIIYL
ncbi:MAG: cob(I)yrinic acid a,c-diamide adenosyltransferase, partial [Limisphaerales bacterium]